MQPVSHREQQAYEKAQSRVSYLYYTKYKRQVKRELGLGGQQLYQEGIRRAKEQVKEENRGIRREVAPIVALPKPDNAIYLVRLIKP